MAWCGLALFAALACSAAAPATSVLGTDGTPMNGSARLRAGEPVPAGAEIDTGAQGAVRLRLHDGSGPTAASGTHVTLVPEGLRLDNGLLRLDVPEPGPGPSVTTRTSVARLRGGGAWLIASAAGGATQVGTLSGLLTLANPAGRSVSVPAGWGSRLEPGLAPTLPRAWSQVEFDGFLRRTTCCGDAAPKP